MSTRRPWLAALVRLFYWHFYNRLAFTYDFVSRIVSRGEWWEWGAAALPYTRGPRVLEVAVGTGNLLVDLAVAGLAPIGLDLSPYMLEITQSKLRGRALQVPLVRARAQQLPFPNAHFDSVVMTFPPGFAADVEVMRELQRVLAIHGRIIWVDAPHLYPRDLIARALNWAYHLTGTSQPLPEGQVELLIQNLLPRENMSWQIERVDLRSGYVHVMIGQKETRAT